MGKSVSIHIYVAFILWETSWGYLYWWKLKPFFRRNTRKRKL